MSKREAILESATRLFAAKGYRETSSSDLARMTGSSEGTIFYHFGSKQNLFLAVLENVEKEILGQYSRYLEEHEFESGLQMLEEIVAFHLSVVTERDVQFRLLHRHYAYELAEVNEECRGRLESIYDCLLDVIERAIAAGQTDGTIGAVDQRRTALLIFAMVDGLVRLRNHHVYAAGFLCSELLAACRRMVRATACLG